MATIILIGGGEHARVVLDAIRAGGEHAVSGIVDNGRAAGETVDGVPVVGTDADLPRVRAGGTSAAVVAIGSVGDPTARVRAAAAARTAGLGLATIVHPRAIVSDRATLGEGVFVGAGAVIGTGATIGCCAIVNTGAIVDHDCRIGEFAHVAPGAVMSGRVTVGDRSHVGTGASIMQGVTIGPDSIVGVGSTVVGDVPAGVMAYGNPCTVVRDSGAGAP